MWIKTISKHWAAILAGPIALVVLFSGILMIPELIINFNAGVRALSEKWTNASQWTGFYSSYPEGVVNMAELGLSVESDVVVHLTYSENDRTIDGYLHSNSFCERGFIYRNVLLASTPSIWAPNRLNIDVYDFVQGYTVKLGQMRIDRDSPQGGVIAIVCRDPKRCLFADTLRLAFSPHFDEEELEFRCPIPLLDRNPSESFRRHE